ncbi:MAG: M1 family metallopeptidase [Candidatus Bathyarchaeia archaeon]
MRVNRYDLYLDIDFRNLSFKGRVLIDLASNGDVVLNSVGLHIQRALSGGRDFPFEQKGDDLIIKTGPLQGLLEVEYTGRIQESLVGLYKAPYRDSYILTTQFEAANARRMFPCLDHPAHKAVFKLAVKVDADLDVISNMPAESERLEGERKVVSFQETPRMSTYLLYLGIGRFEQASESWEGKEILVATRPGTLSRCSFALEVAKKALSYYRAYFGIPYALPKLHLVAVPEFAAFAMENWGAVTFREAGLHVDEKSSLRTKKRVAEVVAHELAHMWFGNLVTMSWWSDLWLNESFATFMSYKALQDAYPEWKPWQDFMTRTSGALSRDGLKNTHPIRAEVSSPEEIEQIFDEISYSKGASVLRMIEAFIGEDSFRKGVSQFLTRFAYSNAAGDELWAALEEASSQQVRTIMKRWIETPGYPAVTVQEEKGRLKLRQSRFLLSGEAEAGVWPIPLTMNLDNRQETRLFDSEELEIEAKGLRSLNLNAGQAGFYRVHYQGLYGKVMKAPLSALERWGVASDAYAFFLAGKMPLREYLKIVERYGGEREFLPAYEVSGQLLHLYAILPKRFAPAMRAYHRMQVRSLERRRDEEGAMLRGIMAARLCRVDSLFANRLGRSFNRYDKVEPDMREAVAVAYAMSRQDYDGLLKAFREAPSDEEKTRLLGALTAFKDPALVALTLGLLLSGEVKRQDVGSAVAAASINPYTRDVVWRWLRTNIRRLEALYEGTGGLSRILLSVIPLLGIGRAREVEQFFSENRLRGAESGVRAGLEKLSIYEKMNRRLTLMKP